MLTNYYAPPLSNPTYRIESELGSDCGGVVYKAWHTRLLRQVIMLPFLLLLIFSFSACSEGNKPLTAAEFLDLGEKYLLEMDYEQAIVQFLKAIEIEPMNPRGYTGAAEAYVGLGDLESAVAVLQRGLMELPDDSAMHHLFDEISLQMPEIILKSAFDVSDEVNDYLNGLLTKYKADGFESILQMIDSAEFRELLAQVEELPLLLLNDAGNHGIGVYSQFIYIGGYSDNLRNGYGIWFDYAIDFWNFQYEGDWSNDLPNGSGTVMFDEGNGTGIATGIVSNGLWNGSVEINDPIIGAVVIEMVNGRTEYYWGSIEKDIEKLQRGRGVIPFANNPY